MQSAYCQASDGGVEGVRPLARFLTAFSRKKAVSPKADAFRPRRRAAVAARSRSNRKPQQEAARTPLRSACSRPIVRLPMAGLRGCAPSRVFSPLFRAKKRCRRRLMPSDLTAERQRPQGAVQIESRNKKLHALLCAARAVSFPQGLTMWGQGACPLRSLGVLKGVFSTVENTPFVRCRALRGRYSSSGSSHGVIVATRRWMGVPSSWNFAS